MDSEGTLLPPGAELRVRINATSLLKATQMMAAASKDRPAGLGPQMMRIQAVVPEDSVPHLLISCDTGEMVLERAVVGVKILDEGSVSVLLPEFLAKLKTADAETVEMSVLDAEKILLRTSRTRWEISGSVGHWYDDREELHPLATLKAEALSKAIIGVIAAAPKAAGRPVLERIQIAKGWATATNGSLLLRHKVEGELFDLDIPRRIAALIATVREGDVAISKGKKTTLLEFNRVSVLLKDPSLKFPDTQKIYQAAVIEESGLLIAQSESMLEALGRVRAYADKDKPSVTLRSVQTAKGWTVVLTSVDRSGNMAKEALGASWQDEKRLNATFHHEHLEALLRSVGEGEVEMQIALQGKSLLIEDQERGIIGITQQIVTD